MKSAVAEDCGDFGGLDENDRVESIEYAPSLTIFRNPIGLITVFVSGAVFYSSLAYAIWRIIR